MHLLFITSFLMKGDLIIQFFELKNSSTKSVSNYCTNTCYSKDISDKTFYSCYDIIYRDSFGSTFFWILAALYIVLFYYCTYRLVNYINYKLDHPNQNIHLFEKLSFYLSIILCCGTRL